MRKHRARYLIIVLVLVLAAGGTVLGIRLSADSGPGGMDGFVLPVPTAALSRPLGAIPALTCSAEASQACSGTQVDALDILKGNYPLTVAGLGLPVGGVGAGSFMINQSGTFGPWDFGGSQNATWEMRALPQAAFHVREQVGSAAASVRTLATDGPRTTGPNGLVSQRSWGSPLPAWNTLKPGDGTYSSLYPFGWVNYKPLATDVSMQFYSPIVAGEDERTSLPLVYFDVQLANHTGKEDSVSVMFTMPNAPAHATGSPTSVRSGFSSAFQSDARTGVQAVTLRADSPSNTPDAANSEWTIAAKPTGGQKVTYTTSWNGNGDGSDIYKAFGRDGQLGDAPLDKSSSAGAVAVSAKLAPGETTTIPFALSWDFPQISFDKDQTVWMRRYTDFYGARETATNDYVRGSYSGRQSFRIADDALTGQQSALKAVESWWSPIANNAAYPTALRTASLNQLYQLVFNSSFWEGGLVSNKVPPTGGRRIGAAKPGTHLFDTVDSTAPLTADSSFALVNNSNEMDVDSYGYLAYDLLFPNLERDRLRAENEATMLDPYSDPRIYTVTATSDPFVSWTTTDPPTPGKTQFADIPSKLVYRDYAYALINHGDGFLREAYPAMVKNLKKLQGLVPADSFLPLPSRDFANTYDVIPTNGVDVYDSELYLLSLEIVIKSGQQLSRPASELAPLQGDLNNAKAEFETTFWDPVHQYYRYTPGPTGTEDATLFDTFFAQGVAERLGLPDLVDLTHYRQQLRTQYPAFVKLRDGKGRLLGAPNMILPGGAGADGNWPFVGPYGLREETEVWSGTNFEVAATYLTAGARFKDNTLTRDGVALASAVSTQIWQVPENGFAFNSPEAWNQKTTELYRYPAYARALSIWGTLDAIHPLTAVGLTQNDRSS
ncbi:hypothetical protein I6A62_22620 [Frankia sp. AgW1.1]|nr:hypothetical protein [Frankia sp. AgW1.1]